MTNFDTFYMNESRGRYLASDASGNDQQPRIITSTTEAYSADPSNGAPDYDYPRNVAYDRLFMLMSSADENLSHLTQWHPDKLCHLAIAQAKVDMVIAYDARHSGTFLTPYGRELYNEYLSSLEQN